MICKIAGYVPNGLIPEADDCGDYIRLRINHDGMIENWPEKADFSEFTNDAEVVKSIDTDIEEEPILDTKVEFTYSQLMSKLLRLPNILSVAAIQDRKRPESVSFVHVSGITPRIVNTFQRT